MLDHITHHQMMGYVMPSVGSDWPLTVLAQV